MTYLAPALRAHLFVSVVLVAALLAGSARAADVSVAIPLPTLPAWLHLPPALPEGAVLATVGDDEVAGTLGAAALVLRRVAEAPAGALDALVAAEGGTRGEAHWLDLAGRWVEGRRIPAGKASILVATRALPDGRTLALVARGPGRDVGSALDLVALLRLDGEAGPVPAPLAALGSRPEVRVNPVGLFVRLPEGWAPKLDKKEGGREAQFTLAKKGVGRLRLARATGADLRARESADRLGDEAEGATVQLSLWQPPGAYRAWQLLTVAGGSVTAVRERYVVRFQKLDDWIWFVLDLDASDPGHGLAALHAVLASVRLIP